jgi:transposase
MALVRRLNGLQQNLQQEKNRLQEPGLIKPVIRSLQKTIRFLEKEIASVKAEIRNHIGKDDGPDGLKESMELLLSVPGIGETLATLILAELPDVSTFKSASSVGAYAGLSPKEHKSGTSVNKRTRISRKGNAHLRCALFMPALSAYRHNPLLAEFYERLIKRGMPRKAAVCAVMRKLLMMAYGVLKNRQRFQLDWVQQQQDARRNNNTHSSLCASVG